jgi:hypothetical protein
MGKDFLDRFSLLHFAVGIVAYFMGVPFWIWAFLQLVFEAVENSGWGIHFISKYLSWWPGGKREPDSLLNSISDILFGSLGWLVAEKICGSP